MLINTVDVSVLLRSESGDDKFRGFLLMADVGGARGLGYFIPSLDSRDLVQSLDCPDLPSTCPDWFQLVVSLVTSSSTVLTTDYRQGQPSYTL